MRTNQKGLAHLFLIVVIVLIGIAGLLYYSWQKSIGPEGPLGRRGLIKTTPSQDSTPNQIDSAKDTSDWKLFQNDEYRIKYPNDWLLGPFSGGGIEPDEETKKRGEIIITNYYIPDDPVRSITGDGIRIEIIIQEMYAESGDTFEKYIDDIKKISISDNLTNLTEESIQFAGHRAIKIVNEYKSEDINYKSIFIFIDKTQKVYWIGYTLNDQNIKHDQTINQILSTFRFLD